MQKKLQSATASTTWIANRANRTSDRKDPGPLSSWRARVLERILLMAVLLDGLATTIQYFILESEPEFLEHVIVWGLLLLSALIILTRKIPVAIRAFALLLFLYAGTIFQLMRYGLGSGALLLMVSLPPLSLILIGRRAGLFSVITSLVIFLTFLGLRLSPTSPGIPETPRELNSVSAWLEIGISFVVLTGFVYFLMHRFYELTVRNATDAMQRAVDAEQGKRATIFALADLAEHRDEDTGSHLNRVANFSQVLAADYAKIHGFEEPDFSRNTREASVLHDIGKVGIPDEILLKPARLDQQDFDFMKKHTTIGANHLKKLNETYPGNPFIQTAIEIAEYHHENWDGTGYPEGLHGESIPISARIVAIADSYDTITSDRPYQKARSHEEAIHSIVEQSATRYDPELVDIFLKNADRFLEIHKNSASEQNQSVLRHPES